MQAEEFASFRLVGGTSLSLQRGHRKSLDIDLFTDSLYGSVNFDGIDNYLEHNFLYVDHIKDLHPGMGKSYLIGDSSDSAFKLDLYYTDPFMDEIRYEDAIRLATEREICAMKLDVIQREGRKKDFWDIHELLADFELASMLELHKQRYPHNHDRELIIRNLTNFDRADEDFDPDCLKGKEWEFIKEDIIEHVESLRSDKR